MRDHDHLPFQREIAEHLQVTSDDVLLAMDASHAHTLVPLDPGADAESDAIFRLVDRVGDDDPVMGVVDDRVMLTGALAGVSAVEQRVLHLKFHDGHTQSEIGRMLGMSQMQVSRLLRKSIAALRIKLAAPKS